MGETRKYSFGCDLAYRVAGDAVAVLSVEAAHGGRQAILHEDLSVSPQSETETHVSGVTGNRLRRLRLTAGDMAIRYRAEAVLEPLIDNVEGIGETPVGAIPLHILPYLLPTRFCPSDRLAAFAAAEFGAVEPGHSRVSAICNWIHERIDYVRGTSDAETTAAETLLARSGVCRDVAHLGIAFCRGLSIPARFVSSYAFGLVPGDFHAVFEAYLDGRWYLFDPTRQAALDGIIRIGTGRDAAEVAFATFYGPVTAKHMRVFMEGPAGAELSPRTAEAVSIA